MNCIHFPAAIESVGEEHQGYKFLSVLSVLWTGTKYANIRGCQWSVTGVHIGFE